MNRYPIRMMLAAGLVLTATLGVPASASASFHLERIREVHEGIGSNGDYVELQSMATGENFVGGKHIVTYDAGGGVLTDYTIPTNVANGADQATILIANAPTVAGVTPDFVAGNGGTGPGNLNVDNTGGTVCYTDSSITLPLDCVAFDHSGHLTPIIVPFAGAPFGSPVVLPPAHLA